MPDDPKITRCIRVLEALFHSGEMATRDVMGLLGVDRQTAMRDLRSLREAGVPLTPVGYGSQRRYRLESVYRKIRTRITVGDVLALHLGRQLLAFVPGARLANWLEDLRERLAPAMDPAESDAVHLLGQRLVYVPDPFRQEEKAPEAFDEVLAALLDERELAIEVGPPPVAWPRVHPLSLVLHRETMVLIGQVPGREGLLRVPLERIQSARRLGGFQYPGRVDVQQEIARAFALGADREAEAIRLRVSRRVAERLQRGSRRAMLSIGVIADDLAEVRLFASGETVRDLVLGFGSEVEVVEPIWLRESVRDDLEKALAAYRR